MYGAISPRNRGALGLPGDRLPLDYRLSRCYRFITVSRIDQSYTSHSDSQEGRESGPGTVSWALASLTSARSLQPRLSPSTLYTARAFAHARQHERTIDFCTLRYVKLRILTFFFALSRRHLGLLACCTWLDAFGPAGSGSGGSAAGLAWLELLGWRIATPTPPTLGVNFYMPIPAVTTAGAGINAAPPCGAAVLLGMPMESAWLFEPQYLLCCSLIDTPRR